MLTLHHDIQFSGRSPADVASKLLEFQTRCAAQGVLCHCGPGEVAFGIELSVTYEFTLSGDPQAIAQVLQPRRVAASSARRTSASLAPRQHRRPGFRH